MKMQRSKVSRFASNQPAESDSGDRPAPDLSILRKSIKTSITGLTQALSVFNTGTEELKQLLTTECDVIYECKVCRNLFRSLANFISHKRVYCRQKFNTSLHAHFIHSNFINDDMLAILQNEKDYQNYLSNKDKPKPIDEDELSKKPLRQKKKMTKDLTSIIERLAQSRETPNSENNECSLINQRISNLQTMSTSKQAVYQNVELDKITSKNSIKDEVAELDRMISSTVAVLGPDGKIVNKVTLTSLPDSAQANPVIQISDEDEDACIVENEILVCKICQLTFATQKTLKFHVKHKHADNRLVYPCPDCADTFSNSWSVYRHLFKVHRKSAAHIRKLRDSIQNKAYRTSSQSAETAKTLASTPVTDLLTDQQRLDQENQAWMDNFEGDETPRCGGCGRRFERRAALSSHRQTCQLRIAAQNKINSNAQRRSIAKAAIKEAETSRATLSPEAKSKNKTDSKSEKKIEIKIRRDYNKVTAPSPSKLTFDFNDEDAVRNRELNIIENGGDQNLNNLLVNRRKNTKDCDISSIIPTIKDSDDVYVIVSTEVISSNSVNGDGDLEDSLCKIDDLNNLQETNIIDDSDLNLEDIQRICNVSDEIKNDLKELSVMIESPKKSCDVPEQSRNDDENVNDDDTSPADKMSPLKDDDVIFNVSKSDEDIETENNKALDCQIFKSPKAPEKLHCKKCNVNFGLPKSFRKHMARHLDWKRFKCKDCGYRCFDRNECIQHYKFNHRVHDKFTERIQPLNSAEACSKGDAPVIEIASKKGSPDKILAIVELSDEETSESDEMETSIIAAASESVIINNAVSSNIILELSDDDREINANDNSLLTLRKKRKIKKSPKEIEKKKIKIDDDFATPPKDISAISPKQEKRSANSVDPQKLFNKDINLSSSILLVSKSVERTESDRIVTHIATESDVKNVKKVDKADAAAVPSAGRRPVRNRVKPLNKDFEYDLSNLMKLEAEAYKGSHSLAAVSQKQQLKRKPFLQKETLPVDRPVEIRGPKDQTVTPKLPIPPLAPVKSCHGALQEASRHASQRGKAQIKNHPSANACRHHQPFIQSLQWRSTEAKDQRRLSEPTLTSRSMPPVEMIPPMKMNSTRIVRRPFTVSMTSEKSSSDITPPKTGSPTTILSRTTPPKKLNISPVKIPKWKIKSIERSDVDDSKTVKSSKSSPRKISILRSHVKCSPSRTSTEKDLTNSVNIKDNKNNSSISSVPKDIDRDRLSDSDCGSVQANVDKFASKCVYENNSMKLPLKSKRMVSSRSNCVKAIKLKMSNYLNDEKKLDKQSILLPDLKFLSKQKSLTDNKKDIDRLSNRSFSDSDSTSSFKLTVNTESICDLELNKHYERFSDKDLIEVEYHVDAIMSDEHENG